MPKDFFDAMAEQAKNDPALKPHPPSPDKLPEGPIWVRLKQPAFLGSGKMARYRKAGERVRLESGSMFVRKKWPSGEKRKYTVDGQVYFSVWNDYAMEYEGPVDGEAALVGPAVGTTIVDAGSGKPEGGQPGAQGKPNL